MMSLKFHPAIQSDVTNAYRWYENQAGGLGEAFLSELDEAFITISAMPSAWPLTEPGMRKFILKRFPYSVIFSIRETCIFVVVVMHQSRKPGYWKDRLSEDG